MNKCSNINNVLPHRLRESGVRLIGACCGSTPEHLSMMRQVLDGVIEPPEVEFEVAVTKQVVKRERSGRRRRGGPSGASF